MGEVVRNFSSGSVLEGLLKLKKKKVKGRKGNTCPLPHKARPGSTDADGSIFEKEAQLQTKGVKQLNCSIKAVGSQLPAKQHASHSIPEVYLAQRKSCVNLVLATQQNNVFSGMIWRGNGTVNNSTLWWLVTL